MHPDTPHFPACPFGEQNKPLPGGRVRKQAGDRYCHDPDRHHGESLVVLADCLACKWPTSKTPPAPRPPKVGDVLARILKERRNASPSTTCDCEPHVQEMNNWGPDGCEEHFDTIVGWLLAAASGTPGVHRWIPELIKRPVLEGDVRDAIREVREWTPPAVSDLTTPSAA